MSEVVEALCDIRRTVTEALAGQGPLLIDPHLKTLIAEQMEKLDRITVTASITAEALDPVFETGNGRGGVLSCVDLCYNAFMIGRNMENREGGGRCDWFNDTLPLMVAGVERLRKETLERMAYARDDRRRMVTRNTEKTECTLSSEEIDAGAACLYGHLDVSFTGGEKVNYVQASAHTQGKYQRAFASAVVASERAKVPA